MTKGDPIPFNRPARTEFELEYLSAVLRSGHLSGNGPFTKRCQAWFERRYENRCLLTTSATSALELSALLARIGPGDEVIVPTYTFVTTASAFLLRGAKVVFADSEEATPNLDVQAVANLISPRTKAVVPVHYAGISCDMDPLVELCRDAGVLVIEDAAQAVDAYYKGRRLGGIGDMGVFSFHDTKNIQAGEGGLLAIRDPTLAKRAEIHWEKGTNRAAFFRGEIDKYGWVELGSSFLPSELVAAVLFAQLEKLTEIQARRVSVWQRYAEGLAQLSEAGFLELPLIPAYASNNAHMFYVLARTPDERSGLLAHLRDRWISATFHYLPLHSSPYFQSKHDGRPLPRADSYAARILRLPLFYDLRDDEIDRVIEAVRLFFSGRS